MKLCGKKQWILIIVSLVAGLILTAILLKLYFNEIEYWILIVTGFVGLIIAFLVCRYANK
jgi:hypothetical protein